MAKLQNYELAVFNELLEEVLDKEGYYLEIRSPVSLNDGWLIKIYRDGQEVVRIQNQLFHTAICYAISDFRSIYTKDRICTVCHGSYVSSMDDECSECGKTVCYLCKKNADDYPYCPDCYDRLFLNCAICDNILKRDDDYYYTCDFCNNIVCEECIDFGEEGVSCICQECIDKPEIKIQMLKAKIEELEEEIKKCI